MRRGRASELDRAVAGLAARQHGVVSRRQVLELGLTSRMVSLRLQDGRLRPLHWGVYLLGALSGGLEPLLAREKAAALACGARSFVSHESAGRLWNLARGDARGRGRSPVHVTGVGRQGGRRRPGIRLHSVASIAAEDTSMVEGIPVTAPARTLVDLASSVGHRALEQAVAHAERLGLADLDAVSAALERRPRAKGGAVLRQWIARNATPAFTRSAAEDRLLALVRKGGLPEPETNTGVQGMEVDFLWPAERVVVEVDGFAYHSGRGSFEGDRDRGARLAAAGLVSLRVTWRQLVHESETVLVRIAQTLAMSR